VIAVRCDLVFTGSDNGYPVLAHQSADTAVTNIQTKLFQLFGHSRSAIAVQTQAMLLPDMGQQNHVFMLTKAGRPVAPGSVATWGDIHNPAKPLGGDAIAVLFNKYEPHLLWSAKKIVAFF
jgi:hypothetical protein